MFKISPFTPLFFHPSTDRFGVRSRYTQAFAKTDRILIEVLSEGGEPPELLLEDVTSGTSERIGWQRWTMNDECTLFFRTLTGLGGLYRVSVGADLSEPFIVTDDRRIMDYITLLQYSNADNRQRDDGVFWIDRMQYFFDFRVPGGFKDGDWSFGVENEQFTTAYQDVLDVHSYESVHKTFTLGCGEGVPIWFAEQLNRLLSCGYVYFDGVRYTRLEGGTPEINQTVEGQKSFVFKQGVQRVKISDPALERRNQAVIRRVNGTAYRTINDKPRLIWN